MFDLLLTSSPSMTPQTHPAFGHSLMEFQLELPNSAQEILFFDTACLYPL